MSLPLAFATKTMESTCTVWVGATNNKGYGLISVSGTVKLAHRVAYEAAFGPIPDGLIIDHKCRVRCCVKPEHLEAVTYSENLHRGRSAARLQLGDECPNGHLILAGLLYISPDGRKHECMTCRREGKRRNRAGLPRVTRQRRADAVAADVELADTA